MTSSPHPAAPPRPNGEADTDRDFIGGRAAHTHEDKPPQRVFIGWGDVVPAIRSAALRCWQKAKTYWAAIRDAEEPPPDPTNPMPSWSKILSVVTCTTAAWGGLWALVQWVDPLGIENAMDRNSQAAVDRFLAPFYASSAQDRIAVVLIDDHTLEAHQAGWPPQYGYYADIFRKVARQNPQAIFLDFVFQSRRPHDDSFEDAWQTVRQTAEAKNVKTLVARSAPDAAILPEVLAAAGGASAVVGWEGYKGGYPLFAQSPDGNDDPGCSTAARPTVAMALWRLACRTGTEHGCNGPAPKDFDEGYCSPMRIEWGGTVPAIAARRDLIDVTGCRLSTESWLSATSDAVVSAGRALLSGVVGGHAEKSRVPCPYAVTLFAEDLDDPDKADVLRGRIVLIGAAVTGINDYVLTPVHGRLPGVYLHAMALDNLMTHGPHYRAEAPEITFTNLNLAHILVIAMGMLVVGYAYRRRLLAEASGRVLGPRDRFLVFRFGVLVTLLGIVTMHAMLRWPPANWLGMLAVFALISHFMETHE